MKKIWANCVIKNEENFIWFAIMSVVDHVEKVLVWDTGSQDKTVEIIRKIQKIKKNKVELKQIGDVDKRQFSKVRQEMLDKSNCDWILILDGDEVWWESSIKMVVDTINKKGDYLDAVVVPFYSVVGDIYHHQADMAGKYNLLGRKGHLTIRAINTKIKGLHVGGSYGSEGYLDENNIPIQQGNTKRMLFINAPFLHLTHLKRSSLDDHNKYKYEIGEEFPENFKYPEVFYLSYPKVIPSPWKKNSGLNFIKGKMLTPFRKIKRKFL